MTATPENEDHCLRDSEVALTNAISTILEIIIAKGILSPKMLDQALKAQSDNIQSTICRERFSFSMSFVALWMIRNGHNFDSFTIRLRRDRPDPHDRRLRWFVPVEKAQQMTKSQTEMLEMLADLIDEYSDFQRSRPDLPQGRLRDLSQDELELLLAAFQLHKSEQDERQAARPWRVHWRKVVLPPAETSTARRWLAMAAPA
jgi:hypothetical protein